MRPRTDSRMADAIVGREWVQKNKKKSAKSIPGHSKILFVVLKWFKNTDLTSKSYLIKNNWTHLKFSDLNLGPSALRKFYGTDFETYQGC